MKILAKIIGGLLLIGLVLAILIPGGTSPQSAYQVKIRSDIRQICIAVNVYHQSSGKIPQNLDEIPEQILEKEFLFFYDPESGRPYDWMYFGDQLNDMKIKYSSVLIVAPTLFGTGDKIPTEMDEKFRLVGFMDGHVERMTQTEFEALNVDQSW
jgi:hypothetical protein